jgi:hypothetical protein
VLLLLGAVLLLVPVIIFIVMATRVAAAHREQRLAAIRLVGATRLQAAVVAAVETGLGAVAGTALGWAGYEAGRRILAATLTFQGARFFVDDVVVAPWLLALVLAGVPLLAMLTTIVAPGRVQAGPLAISRHGRRPAAPGRRQRDPRDPRQPGAAVRHPHDRRLRDYRTLAVHARRARPRPRRPAGARADRGAPHRQ